MFDENSEIIMSFYPSGRYAIRVRCVHDDGASVMDLDLSPLQFQKLLHYLAQQKFMEYDDEFGLSFKCPVVPHMDDDGKLKFDVVGM